MLLPIVASIAVQCDQAPRGGIPTLVVKVDLVLNSVPEPPPADSDAFIDCLNRMDGLQNHVRPRLAVEPRGAIRGGHPAYLRSRPTCGKRSFLTCRSTS